MSYLLPKDFIDTRRVLLVLTFGKLSYLEACTILSDEIVQARMVCERVAVFNLSNAKSKKVEILAGIHKLAIATNGSFSRDFEAFREEITKIFEIPERKINFCVSLYCADESEYDNVVSDVLGAIREAGFKKANLLRAHRGTELHAREIIARNAIDIIVYLSDDNYSTGITAFIPKLDVHARAVKRPITRPEISLSPRLAMLLINLAGLSRGDLMLDPFCGAGTILAEAVLLGINCLGVDRNPSRIDNAKRNLDWVSREFHSQHRGSYSFKLGDATMLGSVVDDRRFDAVITEPILLPRFTSTPSLENAKSAVRRASKIYSSSLYSIAEVVKKGGRIVMVVPSLRTSQGKDVSITLEGFEEIGLREFQPRQNTHFEYPVKLSFESTRWVRRMVYVFERV